MKKFICYILVLDMMEIFMYNRDISLCRQCKSFAMDKKPLMRRGDSLFTLFEADFGPISA
jgi:hypothetical protein